MFVSKLHYIFQHEKKHENIFKSPLGKYMFIHLMKFCYLDGTDFLCHLAQKSRSSGCGHLVSHLHGWAFTTTATWWFPIPNLVISLEASKSCSDVSTGCPGVSVAIYEWTAFFRQGSKQMFDNLNLVWFILMFSLPRQSSEWLRGSSSAKLTIQ